MKLEDSLILEEVITNTLLTNYIRTVVKQRHHDYDTLKEEHVVG